MLCIDFISLTGVHNWIHHYWRESVCIISTAISLTGVHRDKILSSGGGCSESFFQSMLYISISLQRDQKLVELIKSDSIVKSWLSEVIGSCYQGGSSWILFYLGVKQKTQQTSLCTYLVPPSYVRSSVGWLADAILLFSYYEVPLIVGEKFRLVVEIQKYWLKMGLLGHI